MEQTIRSVTGKQWKGIGPSWGVAWPDRQLRKPSRQPPGRGGELAADSIGLHGEESTDDVILIKGGPAAVTIRIVEKNHFILDIYWLR